ncbi:uncharacterized protein LOC144545238 [Carex rostrata]
MSESHWKMEEHSEAKVLRSGDPLVEVFACRIHRELGARCSAQNFAAENYQPNYEPHTPLFIPGPMPVLEPEPEPEIYSNSPQSPPFIQPRPQCPPFIPLISVGSPSLPGPEPNPHPRPPRVQEDPTESKFEFMNEVPDENLQTGDEWGEGDLDDEEDEEDEEYTQPTVRQNRDMPLSGRSETHPFVNFNDTSVFRETDVSYYGYRIEYKSELAKVQYFTNKKQLTKKIREYHVDKNQEIYTKRSDTSQLEIRSSTPGCRFKLKAKATNQGDTWKITEQDTPHTCTSEYTRTDHAQLTASIIADIIGPSIKEDSTMSIRSVANCVRVRFGSITPKYSKVWRGRECCSYNNLLCLFD